MNDGFEGKFQTEKYFEIREGKHCCRVDGCVISYSVKTGSDKKKKHALAHINEGEGAPIPSLRDRERAVIRLVATAVTPFSIVENPNFRIATTTNMTRHRVRDELIRKTQNLIERFQATAFDIDWISMTTDMWKSKPGQWFASFTYHFVKDGEFESVLAGFLQVDPPHTANVIAELIEGQIEKFGLIRKCLYVTTDAASSNILALEQLRQKRSTSSPPEPPITRITCVCHVLHHVVLDTMKNTMVFVKEITKANNLSQVLRLGNNPISLRKACHACGKEYVRAINWTKTRWNTLYAMLKRLLELKPAIIRLYAREPHIFTEKHILSGNEWSFLNEIVNMLEVIADMSNELGSSKKSVISHVLYLYRDAMQQIRGRFEDEPSDGNRLDLFARELYHQLTYRFDSVDTETHRIASILDPAFKLDTVRDYLKTEVIEQLLNTIKDQMSDSPMEQPLQIRKRTKAYERLQYGTRSESASDELNNYLKTPATRMAGEDDWDMISGWNRIKEKYPRLYQVARKYMPILPSSVASECVFSQAKKLITDDRNRLGSAAIEAQMIAHAYWKDNDNPSSDEETPLLDDENIVFD